MIIAALFVFIALIVLAIVAAIIDRERSQELCVKQIEDSLDSLNRRINEITRRNL